MFVLNRVFKAGICATFALVAGTYAALEAKDAVRLIREAIDGPKTPDA